MEALPLRACSFPPQGSFRYRDDYGTTYEVNWSTAANGNLDITTVTKQPYVWGLPDVGRIEGQRVIRRGILTIHRMVIMPITSGYIIIAEGSVQVIDSFQVNAPAADPFCYHLNCAVSDELSNLVRKGSHWMDPAHPTGDELTVWADAGANPTANPVYGAGTIFLQWINVWA